MKSFEVIEKFLSFLRYRFGRERVKLLKFRLLGFLFEEEGERVSQVCGILI